MRRRSLANAGALGVSLGVLIGIRAAGFAVWANGDLQHAMFRLPAMRTRDSVIFWVLACVAVMVPLAAVIERFRLRTFDVDWRWLRVVAAVSLLIAVLLHAASPSTPAAGRPMRRTSH